MCVPVVVRIWFRQSLAVVVGAQALAATGGKSTLTATEWILGQMESRNSSMPKHQTLQVWVCFRFLDPSAEDLAEFFGLLPYTETCGLDW